MVGVVGSSPIAPTNFCQKHAGHRLPDGSVKSFPQPGHRRRGRAVHRRRPRAGGARRQGGRQAGRHELSASRRDAELAIVTERDPEALEHHPPLDRAPAGARGEGALSRGAGHHRPGDRERLLLRLLLQAAVHARGSRCHREADGGDRQARPARRAQGDAARRGGEVLPRPGRAVQGRDHRLDPARRSRSRCTARATWSTCAAARTCPPPASSRCSS